MMFTTWVAPSEANNRLDAEFYRPEYVENARIISSYERLTSFERLRKKSKPITYGVLKPQFTNNGVPLIRNQDFSPPSVSSDSVAKISRIQSNEYSRSIVDDGDLLISIGGYVGTAAVVPSSMRGANINQHIARVSLIEQEADPFFYWAFVQASPGKMLLERWVSGTVQAGINLTDLKQLSIPWPSIEIQHAIGNKVRKAERLKEMAGLSWAEAMQKLQSALEVELHAELFENFSAVYVRQNGYSCLCKNPAIMSVIPEDVLGAQYYHPRRINAQAVASMHRQWAALSGLASRQRRARSASLGSALTFVGLDSIDSATGVIFQNTNTASIELNGGSVFGPNDILFSRLRPYLNKVAIWPKHREDGSGSGELLVYHVASGINPYYLFFVLKSPLGLYQVLDVTSGSTHPRVDTEVVDSIRIPRLGQDIEEEIGHLVLKSHECWYGAHELIPLAKSDVEDLINGTLGKEQLLTEGEEIARWLEVSPSPSSQIQGI